MISEGAWDFLRTLPELSRAIGVVSELESLEAAGDRYVARTKAFMGVAAIGAVAAFVSVATGHVVMAQATFVLAIAGAIYSSWDRDRFNGDWRRVAYLHGYVSGQNGDPPQER